MTTMHIIGDQVISDASHISVTHICSRVLYVSIPSTSKPVSLLV